MFMFSKNKTKKNWWLIVIMNSMIIKFIFKNPIISTRYVKDFIN